MRILIVTLGVSLLVSTAAAAQSTPTLVVTPARPFRPSLDFGLDRALKKLPEGPWRVVTSTPKHSLPMQPSLPIDAPAAKDCAMAKKHHHGGLAMRTIVPLTVRKHQLRTAPVAPCPVR